MAAHHLLCPSMMIVRIKKLKVASMSRVRSPSISSPDGCDPIKKFKSPDQKAEQKQINISNSIEALPLLMKQLTARPQKLQPNKSIFSFSDIDVFYFGEHAGVVLPAAGRLIKRVDLPFENQADVHFILAIYSDNSQERFESSCWINDHSEDIDNNQVVITHAIDSLEDDEQVVMLCSAFLEKVAQAAKSFENDSDVVQRCQLATETIDRLFGERLGRQQVRV